MADLRLPSFNDFSPVILKHDLRPCLQAVIDGGGDDKAVFRIWDKEYFGGKANKRSTTNIPATLSSTGLSTGGRPLELSPVGKTILAASTAKDAAKLFCAHLLREKNGKLVIEALTALQKRKIRV